MELLTKRLVLSCPTAADIDSMVRICGDPMITEFTAVPHPYGREDARYFIEEAIPEGWATGSACTWGIYEHSDPSLLGVISLSRIEGGTAELGYWIDKEARGRGLMTEAATEVVDFAFGVVPDGLGLDRVGGEAATENVASAQVAQKVGFSWEGERRRALLRLGRRYDLTVAGLLCDDDRSRTQWPR